MKKIFGFFATLLRWCWKLLSAGSTIVSSLLLLITLSALIGLLYRPEPTVPYGSALVLAPMGNIVEKPTIDPLTSFIEQLSGNPRQQETLLQDMLDAINAAAADSRIELMVINTDQLGYAGLNQIRTLGRAIENFKKNKMVIAFGENFNQLQYYLASYADEIYLNPMGDVSLHGFGVYQLYIKALLDKFQVNFHVFRVGVYKSALEPFMRNDMSAEAKEANRVWLERLWNIYCHDISNNRGKTPDDLKNYIDNLLANLRRADGNSGQMAMAAGLIEGLKTKQEEIEYLTNIVGLSADGTTFNKIDSGEYLACINRTFNSQQHKLTAPPENQIGIIVAQGNIVHGEEEPGMIGSVSLAEEIRTAREDESIRALVLRIDSGGGSAFASELIRQELLLTKESGKPVVVSMGSMAASGGYWLAADANTIFASPVTLTGSIGIFGAFPTFERTLAQYGIASDGTGTTKLAGDGDLTRSLSLETQQALQLKVEEGYERFLRIVAQGRHLSRDKTEQVAEGRVWDGATALQLGLVDKLGDLDDAVAEAARLSGLKDFTPRYLQRQLTPVEEFLQQLSLQAASHLGTLGTRRPFVAAKAQAMKLVEHHFDFLLQSGDPTNIYAHCLIPSAALTY